MFLHKCEVGGIIFLIECGTDATVLLWWENRKELKTESHSENLPLECAHNPQQDLSTSDLRLAPQSDHGMQTRNSSESLHSINILEALLQH